MQQRRLRLGDILDDYCPRERRITNHAVVAMIEDHVKQTRCTTCDADHPYKDGKAPSPRRKKSEGALFHDVLENARPRVLAVPSPIAASADLAEQPPPLAVFTPSIDEPMHDEPMIDEPMNTVAFEVAEAADAGGSDEDAPNDDEPVVDAGGSEDEWPVHRRLIRATLPRPEGQVPERKEPEFTMHRPLGRGVDGNRAHGQRARGGHRQMRQGQGQGQPGGAPARFGGPRHGAGTQGQHGPHRQGQGSGHGHHGQPNGNRAGRAGGHGRKRGR